MNKLITTARLLLLSASLIFIWSCNKDDDPKPELLAGFSYVIDANDFSKVIFTNASQNFETLSWNFGDNSPVSTETSPVHSYAQEGVFTVTLTAARGSETDQISQQITISNPDAQLAALAGTSSKTWKLLRSVSEGRWPLEVGPHDRSQVWWAMGRGNQDIVNRQCTMNDEYTFSRNGDFAFNSNGDFWTEGGVFANPNFCVATTPANLVGPNGEDLTAFGDGSHTFSLAAAQLTVSGLGAFIGLPKIGTDAEVSLPQTSVTLDIVKLSDGAVDTLIVESNYKWAGNTSGIDDAYWRVTLVHYDNPADEPPVVGFSSNVAEKTATFTNNSYDADTYLWNFGDGQTSSEANPVHTYAAAGLYTVTLTGTSGTANAVAQAEITISGDLTEGDLIGAAWRIRNAATSIFVGPALGSPDWWQVPPEFLSGGATGGDDWSCITNDEFIFSAGGMYEYRTNGDARNDGYMGSPNGCWTDAEVAASGNGAAFGSGVHSWSFTPASGSPSGRPIVTVTNGATGAAFVGFYKGYYGGENSNGANAPNGGLTSNQYEVMSYVNDGTSETLVISVDISTGHDGSAAWTMVLVR